MNPVGAEPVDAAAVHEMSAQQLLRRSRRLLWLTLVPVFLLVLLLAAWQAYAQWRSVIESATTEVRTQRASFDGLARDAHHHVAELRHWMQQEFLRPEGRPDPALLAALQLRLTREGQADGYTLDALPELLRGGMGQLLWADTSHAPPPAVLRRAQALSSVIEIAHQRSPAFAWSYFFGWPDKHLVLMPWVPSAAIVEQQGGTDLASVGASWYEYEVVTAGLPEKNPKREAYWTAPYRDAGGLGLLVSHAAPVVVADEVRGIVGTDLKLSTLEALLDNLPGSPWKAWVVDAQGHLLADRQQHVAQGLAPGASAVGATASGVSAPELVPQMAARLPADIDSASLNLAVQSDGRAILAGDQRLIAIGIAHTPWTVVLAAPNQELLLEALPHVLPYTLIASALVVVWLLGHALLRQRFITPVLDVLSYLQRLSADAKAQAPRLSPRWQPWLDVITHTFASMRSSALRERRAEALKSAIVDHAQAAVVVANEQDQIVEFNSAAEVLLGMRRADAIGRRASELICPERYRESYQLALRQMRQGDPERLMGRRLLRTARRADGSELPVEVVMGMAQVDGAAYFTASMTDLSAMLAAKDQIERQRDALRQSEKLTAMGSLLAGVAHELNNPLAIVMGRANLLEDKTEGTALHGDAVQIREAAERCGRIVRTFLNMARSRPAQRSPVRLNDLARAAAEMLGYTLRSHGIALELQLGSKVPEVLVDGDQVGQVVLNLIVNAQQALAAHSGPRRIVVQTGVDTGAAPGQGRVWLRVSDSGPGVPAEVQERIFDPFFTTKAEGMGTGLGLSVSRAIMREHGGDLMLEADSAGASFFMSLPLPAKAQNATSTSAPSSGSTP